MTPAKSEKAEKAEKIKKDITVLDIIALMDQIAPVRLAEDWDNCGLQCGNPDWPVRQVTVALDPSPEVVSAACKQGADLLITHHPLIFRPVKNLILNTPLGRLLEMAISHHLAVFSAHTCLDSVRGGLNDRFAEMIGLQNITLLTSETEGHPESTGHGIGRVGDLDRPMTLSELSAKIKQVFGPSELKVSGPADMTVKNVALCTGSGSGLMKAFFASGADVYISGDLKFHDAKDARMQGRALIDVGHFASEIIMTDLVAGRLEALIRKNDWNVTVKAFRDEKDPFYTL